MTGANRSLLTGTPLRRRLAWSVWAAGFLIWTYLLVVPTDWLPPWLRFGMGGGPWGMSWGKVGHAGGYAGLTALAFHIAAGTKWRWAFVIVMSLHAFGTELVQSFVPTRTGSWNDVGIDHIGLVVGLALCRLGDWCGWGFGAGRTGRERVAAEQEADGGAGREDAQADPL